jgi:uncharacterized membrane protein
MEIIWYFFLYSILGYICEVIYCSIGQKRWVNRGFLHGPWIPVYGFGALAALGIKEYVPHPAIFFLLAILATSMIEYITGWMLETVFHIRLWDYRDHRFQLHGRICLLNALLFGLLALGVGYGLHPMIAPIVNSFSERLRSFGASGMLLILAVDTTASISSMAVFADRLNRVKNLHSLIENRLEELTQELRDSLEGELARIFEQLRKSGTRLLNAFPTMHADALDRQLQSVRDLMKKHRKR